MLSFTAQKRLGAFRFSAAFEGPDKGLLALFGRSGAGKTTLINMLAGLARPDAGRIVLEGRVLFDSSAGIDLPPERRRIGYVFQEGRLFPHLPVLGNLLYGYRRAPSEDRPIGVDEIVSLLGISQLLTRRPGDLSGGEKQRVAIGRALLCSPKMLLLDEPLAALDGERKAEILPYIERLRDGLNLPIVYVSHDAIEILRLADHVLLMEKGGVAAAGPVAEIFGRPELQRLVGAAEAGAVLTARLESHDEEFALSYLRFAGGRLAIARIAAPPGSEMRLRIRARDVALALERPVRLSIQNVIDARIVAVHPADGPYVDVELDAGAPLWARITARSAHDLSLAIGLNVFALVKAVSIDRQTVAAHAPTGGRV
jgi:molybdate transport system ATP-binding protein